MKNSEKFCEKTMGCAHIFQMRSPDGKGYWLESASGYKRPFYGFALKPDETDIDDIETGRITCDKFIAKLNDDDLIHLWRRFNLNPDIVLSEDGLKSQLGKDIMHWSFGTRDDKTVSLVRKVNEAIQKKEKQSNDFF